VITIDNARCMGCGECVSVCPSGAITLLDDKAFVDEELCQECEICISACPQNAILSVEVVEPVTSRDALPDPEPISSEIKPVQMEHASSPMGGEVLPAISSILVSTGREVIPRLASLALDFLDQRIRTSERESTEYTQPNQRDLTRQTGNHRRRRRRRRRKNW
jgi:ferredoxin